MEKLNNNTGCFVEAVAGELTQPVDQAALREVRANILRDAVYPEPETAEPQDQIEESAE